MMRNNKPMLEKSLLLKYKGQARSRIVREEKVSAARVKRAIEHYGIEDQFKGTGDSGFIVPILHITEEQVARYYDKTVRQAANALGCEYDTFRNAIKRKGLFYNFTCNAQVDSDIFCPICRVSKVKVKYKMCEKCKGPGWYS